MSAQCDAAYKILWVNTVYAYSENYASVELFASSVNVTESVIFKEFSP